MPAQSLAYATPHQAPERHANDCAGPAVRLGGGEESVARDAMAALHALPETATLRDVVAVLLGERPTGHGQTYANVVLTQRALARLAEAASGRAVAPWEPAP
jgi:hypothetical protein